MPTGVWHTSDVCHTPVGILSLSRRAGDTVTCPGVLLLKLGELGLKSLDLFFLGLYLGIFFCVDELV